MTGNNTGSELNQQMYVGEAEKIGKSMVMGFGCVQSGVTEQYGRQQSLPHIRNSVWRSCLVIVESEHRALSSN